MGRYLTNTQAYTRLGNTYSGNKSNHFATKENVIDAGMSSSSLTSYRAGQHIPEEDIPETPADPNVVISKGEYNLPINHEYIESFATINSYLAWNCGINLILPQGYPVGTIFRIRNTREAVQNELVKLKVESTIDSGRKLSKISLILFPGIHGKEVIIPISSTLTPLSIVRVTIFSRPGNFEVEYNGQFIYTSKTSLPNGAYDQFRFGAITGDSITIKSFNFFGTKQGSL